MTVDTRKNGQPCAVKFTSRHKHGEEMTGYQVDQMGHWVNVAGNNYIQVDIKLKGEDVVPTTFKISKDGQVSIIRHGEYPTRMRFNLNQMTSMRYKTEHGSLLLDIECKNLQISYQNQPVSGRIYIEYNLYTGRELLGEYELDLVFTV